MGKSMTSAEIVRALRCTSTVHQDKADCKTCPFYCTEKIPEEWQERLGCSELPACNIDGSALAAADLIERLEEEKLALLEIAKARPICATCKYHIGCKAVELANCRRCIRRKDCVCAQCVGWAKWEWKGLVENK